MKSSTAVLFSLLLLCLPALAQNATPVPAPTEKVIADFASAVLPFNKSDFCKWAASPQISCFGQPADLAPIKPIVERFVSEMNGILAGLPTQLVLAADNSELANFKIYVGRRAEVASARRANGSTANTPSYLRWTNDKFIEKFFVYVDLDEAAKDAPVQQRAHFYRRLLRGIGYCGDEVPKGIPSVYTDYWSEPVLTEWDRKAIRFAYEHLPAGSSRSDIRQAVRKKWDLVKLPAR